MRIHLIAIGGAVMHNMALELQANGHQVSGSDDEIFDPAKARLAAAGLLPKSLGWDANRITPEIDAIILGMHARADNIELIKAKELGIKIYSFPEYVYEHAKNKTRVVIGGSHGKTTSTSMLMHVLRYLNWDYDYLVGSLIDGFDRMVRLSNTAKVIIIEGDEYLTSALDPVPKFHKYHPHYSMITGVAWDHINVFPTWEGYVKQFELFMDMTQEQGNCFVFEQDKELADLASKRKHVLTYNTPNFIATDNKTTIESEDKKYEMPFFGEHNLQNAEGVRLLANSLGISNHDFWTAMSHFTGSAKRMEKVAESDDLTVYRDFAHSPSKVKATVKAISTRYSNATIITVLELHTFSSLNKEFIPQYKDCFNPVPKALVLFDPHVLELKKMPALSLEFLEQNINNIKAFNSASALKLEIDSQCKKPGKKVLLLMSSGNFGGEKLY